MNFIWSRRPQESSSTVMSITRESIPDKFLCERKLFFKFFSFTVRVITLLFLGVQYRRSSVYTIATGIFVSSLMNFCTEGMPGTISPEELPRHSLQVPSGWIKNEMFVDWCEYFVSVAKPSASHPVLLILDGHFDHTWNLRLFVKACECHVVMICHVTLQTPAIRQNIHGTTETLLWREKKKRRWQLQNNWAVTHYEVQGDQKVPVHPTITVQKTRKNTVF